MAGNRPCHGAKLERYSDRGPGVRREKHEDYLLIAPDAFSQEVDSPFTTRIDLPLTGTPVCKLAINGR